MNVLEKILEEIDTIKKEYDNEKYHQYFVDGANCAISDIRALIRSQMDDVPDANVGEWIPVSERLPKPLECVLVTVHSSEWVSDYDSNFVPEDEKTHHLESYNVHIGYMNKNDEWIFIDCNSVSEIYCDKEFGTDKGRVYDVVTAWRPFIISEPYKG